MKIMSDNMGFSSSNAKYLLSWIIQLLWALAVFLHKMNRGGMILAFILMLDWFEHNFSFLLLSFLQSTAFISLILIFYKLLLFR